MDVSISSHHGCAQEKAGSCSGACRASLSSFRPTLTTSLPRSWCWWWCTTWWQVADNGWFMAALWCLLPIWVARSLSLATRRVCSCGTWMPSRPPISRCGSFSPVSSHGPCQPSCAVNGTDSEAFKTHWNRRKKEKVTTQLDRAIIHVRPLFVGYRENGGTMGKKRRRPCIYLGFRLSDHNRYHIMIKEKTRQNIILWGFYYLCSVFHKKYAWNNINTNHHNNQLCLNS